MSVLDQRLSDFDPEIAELIGKELERQRSGLEMIASENHAPLAVMQAQGSVLTNKYAEGYPGRRYYGGCEHVDVIEQLAIDRIKALFDAEFANVQPHSGAQSNAAVMHALLKPGDTILGLSLDCGGHLTHGMRLNFSGKLYNVVAYGVPRNDYLIDMDQVAELAREHRPQMIIAGWSAYPRHQDFARFREIADEVGAYLMVDMAHFAGLVAAGLHPSPVPHAHVVTSTTHKTLGSLRGGIILTNEADIAKKLNSAVFPGQQGGPLEHVIAGKAVAFKMAARPDFVERQRRCIDGAKILAERLCHPDVRDAGRERLRNTGKIMLGGRVPVALSEDDIALYTRTVLDFHPNGMTLTAYGADDRTLHRRTYFSVGCGFVVTEGEAATEPVIADEDDTSFSSAAELLALASGTGRPISEVMLAYERRMRGPEEVHAKLLHLRDVMVAPTNGAAGIMPAVLHYAVHYTEAGASDADDVAVRFLLTAGAIGSLYKERASISGAEVGCQGEVGSASSMAAGGLAEILGGTPEQVENAAEIAMEHSLGLTCDPIAGLVQIPCIERNAISAGKAINAARVALRGDGAHRVSLDEVIATMRATGRDMSSKYKETSTGGLAVNVSVNYVGC